MKDETVIKMKMHIGIMAGGKVHASFDVKGGYEMRALPMGVLVIGPSIRTVVTYNNIVSFDLEPKAVDPK